MFKKLRWLVHHPAFNALVGVLMILSAVGEMSGELLLATFGFKLGAAHGVLAVGILHIAKAIPEVVKGVDKVEKAREEEPS